MNRIRKLFFSPTPFKRSIFFLLGDIFFFSLSLFLSFWLRFDFHFPKKYFPLFWHSLPFFVILKLAFLYWFGLYRIIWRYVGLREFVNILKALSLSEIILFVLFKYFFPVFDLFLGYPRSIFLMDLYISILFISGFRITKRVYREFFNQNHISGGKRTLILGAGDVGEMVVRDLARRNFRDYHPQGFLDDDPMKRGTFIHGIPVLGTLEDLEKIARREGVEALIVAIARLSHRKLREVYYRAQEAGIKEIKAVPSLYAYTEPRVESLRLEDLRVEDLLKREEVKVEKEKIRKFLRGKRVLITGAGGSIGSELTRQVASFGPEKLVLFEIDETELHRMMLELKELYPEMEEKTIFVVGDITDREKVERVFREYQPEIVFHAAAYKHVPMMEFNPEEAVRVNIFGTYYVASAAVRYGTKKFIMISTDKAVRPTSIMGATKRMAEYICQALNDGNTEFVSVRFGNVLGSRGSVLPIFLEQIKKGGPVTVTHKDMKRYFMTVSEAVALVLQASVMGRGGQVMVLDMGKPVKILKLAEELIRLHGLEPYKDIAIKFTGLRPGEKLFEELLTAEEGTEATYHERIFIAKNTPKFSHEEIANILKEFQDIFGNNSKNLSQKIKETLRKYVKFYQNKDSL